MASFNFKLNKQAISKINAAQQKALELTAQKMLDEKIEQQEIPFDEGTLQNVQTYVDKKELSVGTIRIVHDTKYAMNLYVHPEYNFSHEFNTKAKGEWWEDFISGNKKERPSKIFSVYLKRESGGVIN